MSTTDSAAQAAKAFFSDVTPGWQRWDAQMIDATRPAKEVLLTAVGITPGMQVLDVATGTGSPALEIVPLVGPQGHVTATDVNPGMVAFAEAKAKRAGLPNISFQVADAADLPFADGQFDAITCSMGVMFFARDRALPELHRVLRPGGRIGFTLWGPYEHNPWLTSIRQPVLRRLRQQPDTAVYAMYESFFHYAKPGTLSADLRNAAFRDVQETVLHLTWSFAGSPQEFWAFQSEIGGAASRPGWDTLTAEEQAAAEAEVVGLLEPYRVGQRLEIPVELNLATATR
jgi:ubiquinone/menaquinone biosynthesis C-methylase UbiE